MLLPSALVIAFGVRMIRQEDELEEKRVRERRQQAIGLIRQELLTRLEGLKLRAAGGKASPSDPEIALAARVEGGRIMLPWQTRASKAEPYLAQLGDPRKAAVLMKTHGGIGDEYGVPVAVYAARRVAGGASAELRRQILARMAAVLDETALSPAAAYMIAEVCRTGPVHEAALLRAQEAETVERLARSSLPADDGWRMFEGDRWLVSATERRVVAVRARRLLDSVSLPAGSRWGSGDSLGEGLPELRVALGPEAVVSTSRRSFYFSGLLLVILVTLFAGYLLHRDVRRETNLAALRSQFVSSVSHELRTPIATIRAFAELIDLGRVASEREKAEYVKTILGESERLSRLVDGVLAFSRIERGEREYQRHPVPLAGVLESAARALAYPLSQGNFELKIATADVPPVSADRDALEQAVVNLLGNAIKYSGGSRSIDLSLAREGEQAVIRVRDQGIGIPIEEQSRVFERFYRAANIGGLAIPGAGLGLALVDHIVKAHGGRVAVESEPGRGSTFSILLPLSTA